MTIDDIVSGAKSRLGLKVEETQFDSDLAIYAADSIARLSPLVMKEVTDISLTSKTGSSVSVPTGIVETKRLEIKLSTQDDEYFKPYDDWSTHAGVYYFQDNFDTAIDIRIKGEKEYDESSISSLSKRFKLCLIYWTMSEFATVMAGNSSRYNIYMQSAGPRAVDNLTSLSQDFEDRANAILIDRADIGGK